MAYEYDIFLSYPRIDPIGPWVEHVFDPELRNWLRAEVGERRVFRDTDDIEPGQRWPQRLSRALGRSKLMIAIWCPPYFTSAWCMAELETMRAREAQAGIEPGSEQALIVPIRFSDGDFFDEKAKARSYLDFWDFSDLSLDFRGDPDWRRMVKAIRGLTGSLKARLDACPSWRADWPILRPAPPPAPAFRKPGFA